MASYPSQLVSTPEDLASFLSTIPPASSLYLNLEGHRLGRHGTLVFITVLVHPERVVKVIDVQALGRSTFTTPSSSGSTLQSILEDAGVPKCLWDVRGDADALWSLYQVDLAGVVDVQLLENYSRPGDSTCLLDLGKAIRSHLGLSAATLYAWMRIKEEIRSGMDSDVFAVRHVEEATLWYCVNDVIHLPDLHRKYLERFGGSIPKAVEEATLDRLDTARSPDYQPHSSAHRFGPWGAFPREGQD